MKLENKKRATELLNELVLLEKGKNILQYGRNPKVAIKISSWDQASKEVYINFNILTDVNILTALCNRIAEIEKELSQL